MILLGCPGSGKSTIYTTLASVLNSMNGRTSQPAMKTRRQTGAERKISTSFRPPKVPLEEIKEAAWPRVDLSVLFPKSLTCEEVYLEIYLECNKTRNTGTHPEQPWSNGTTGMLEHWNTGTQENGVSGTPNVSFFSFFYFFRFSMFQCSRSSECCTITFLSVF